MNINRRQMHPLGTASPNDPNFGSGLPLGALNERTLFSQGPRTLNRAQFRKTKAARKPGASYDKYLAYLAQHRPARIAQRNDPLAPKSPGQIQAGVRSQVNAQINPIIQEIIRSSTAQTKAGMGAIRGYSNQLAQDLGGYQASAKDIYGGAQQSQAALDASIRGALTGQGNELQSDLAGKLAQIGGTAEPQAAQTGLAAGNAEYVSGSADLSRLINQGASAQEYAGKLPGFARLGGLASARELQLSSAANMNNQIGQIRSQAPGLIQELLAKAKAEETDKALAKLANEGDQYQAQAGVQTAQIKARAAAQKAVAERQFKMRTLEQQHRYEMEKARVEFERSQRTEADKRAFKSRQDALNRQFKARQAALDRKARAALSKSKGAAAGGGLVP